MKLLISFCLLFLSSFVLGNTITSTIHSFDIDPQGEDHFIKLNSGEVIFVDDLSIIEDLQKNSKNEIINFSLDQSNKLVYWDLLSSEEQVDSFNDQPTTSPFFKPTLVSGKENLMSIFQGLRKDARRSSECYHRAYIWAYEENKKSNRMLTKHFLFFTRRYIREYRYRWWFHVAPSALFANEDGSQEFIIFDRTFMEGPVSIKKWTDSFIASKRNCPVVYVYSHYNNNQQAEHCYLIPTPMYYLQPLDIENFEKKGVEKQSFVPWDLNLSYRKGFTGPRL